MSRTSLPVQLQYDVCRQILMHYHIHKELQDTAIWTWPSSKGHTKVNIALVRDFDVENISVKLWNDTGNSCRVIVFTRQLDLEPVWKLKKSHKGQCRNLLRFLCREHPCKVTTWYSQSMKSADVENICRPPRQRQYPSA